MPGINTLQCCCGDGGDVGDPCSGATRTFPLEDSGTPPNDAEATVTASLCATGWDFASGAAWQFLALAAGTVTVTLHQTNDLASCVNKVRLEKNGAAVLFDSGATDVRCSPPGSGVSDPGPNTETLTVAAGDVVEMYYAGCSGVYARLPVAAATDPGTDCCCDVARVFWTGGASADAVTAVAQNLVLQIIAPAGVSWAVATGSDWVTVVGAATGTGPGTATIHVDANATGFSRDSFLSVSEPGHEEEEWYVSACANRLATILQAA